MEWFSDEEPFEVNLKNRDKSFGFSIIGGTDTPMNGKGIFIKSIVPGSVDGQLMEGDEIISVNGLYLDTLTHFNVLDLFRRSNNTEMKLLIRRRKNPLPIFANIEEDQTLSKPISFTPQHSSKMNRDSLFHLLQQKNDDNIGNNKENLNLTRDSGEVKKVTVNRLPGEPLGIDINIKRSLGSDRPIKGAFVGHVSSGSAIGRASTTSGGIQSGDEIISINGVYLRSITHLEALQVINEMPMRVEMVIRSKIDRDEDGDNDSVDSGQKGEVTFAETTKPGESQTAMKTNKENETREDSRSFVRGRSKNRTLNTKKETEFKRDVESPSSPSMQDENDISASRVTDDDANDSSFYEHSKECHSDGQDTPLSSYILQSRQSSIKHENFELRKYAFKKRRQDELGIYVEPCIVGNHNYLKVVDMSPDSFLSRHQLVQRGDLLVSYNGLRLKDAAKSSFDAILRNRGMTLEDVCMEILREQNIESDNPEGNVYQSKLKGDDFFQNYEKDRRNLISTEESRTPSPTKPMRPISRDSGMIDGNTSPEGTWGWAAGTESEMDESRTDSPRFGLYFFDERSGETSDKDISLVNFGKLSTEQSANRRAINSKPIISRPSNTKRYLSTRRSRNNNSVSNSFYNENSPHGSNLELSFSDFTPAAESSPIIQSSHNSSSFDTTAENESKPIPIPRKRIMSHSNFQTENTVTTNIPDSLQNNRYHSIQSEKIEAEQLKIHPHMAVTSIDDEIINEIDNQTNKYSLQHKQISLFNAPESHGYSPSLPDKTSEATEDDLYLRFIEVHPSDHRNLLNYINHLLKNPDQLAKLPNIRTEEGIFRINMNKDKIGLGMKLILTPLGAVVQKIEKDGAFEKAANIKIGDFILALNSTPLASMSSTVELQHFLDNLQLKSLRLILCRDPKVFIESIPFTEELLDVETGLKAMKLNLPAISTKISDRDNIGHDLELEFIISNQPIDMGLGHVVEIMGVNTPYTTIIYSEKTEQLVNLEDIQCFHKTKNAAIGMDPAFDMAERRDSHDSFDDDMLLDGNRCGFVSRVESFKRKFKKPIRSAIPA